MMEQSVPLVYGITGDRQVIEEKTLGAHQIAFTVTSIDDKATSDTWKSTELQQPTHLRSATSSTEPSHCQHTIYAKQTPMDKYASLGHCYTPHQQHKPPPPINKTATLAPDAIMMKIVTGACSRLALEQANDRRRWMTHRATTRKCDNNRRRWQHMTQ